MKLANDRSGAIHYIAIVLVVLFVMVVIAALYHKGWEALGAILCGLGLLTIAQINPLLKGMYGVVSGVIVVAFGMAAWFHFWM